MPKAKDWSLLAVSIVSKTLTVCPRSRSRDSPQSSSHHLFHRTCRLIALGEWLRADVVSALSFEAGAGRSSQLLRAAAMSFCFFQSPIAGVPVAANGDPVRGRVVMKQSKKGLHLKRPTRRLPRASVASTPPSRGRTSEASNRQSSVVTTCPAECPQSSRSSRLQWWAPTWIEVTGERRTCIWNISAPASRSTPLAAWFCRALPPHSAAEPRQRKGDAVVSWVMVVLPSMRCNYLPAAIVRRCLDIREAGACSTTLWGGPSRRRPGQRLPCVGRWCTDGW